MSRDECLKIVHFFLMKHISMTYLSFINMFSIIFSKYEHGYGDDNRDSNGKEGNLILIQF